MTNQNLSDIKENLNLSKILPINSNINSKLSPLAIADFVELIVKEGIEGIAEKTIDKGVDELISKIDYISDSLEVLLNDSVNKLLSNVPFNTGIKIVASRIIHLIIDSLKPSIKLSIEKIEAGFKEQVIEDISNIKEQLETFFIEYTQDTLYDVPNYMLGKLKYYEEKINHKLYPPKNLEDDKNMESNEWFGGYLNITGMLSYIFE